MYNNALYIQYNTKIEHFDIVLIRRKRKNNIWLQNPSYKNTSREQNHS